MENSLENVETAISLTMDCRAPNECEVKGECAGVSAALAMAGVSVAAVGSVAGLLGC
jgi:hypothetical protein